MSYSAESRRNKTVGDMIRSMLVVLALVGVLIGFNAAREPESLIRPVDYPAALDAAQPGVDYTLAGPQPLPSGWRVTSARTGRDGEAVTWHLGMVTDAQAYASVRQSDGSVASVVDAVAEGSRRTGTVVIDGREWVRRDGGTPEPRALVSTVDGITTVLAGNASWQELRQLAAALP